MLTDGAGRPVSQVKVTALQDNPISGYGHFETETDAAGRFSFDKLYPESDYTLVINAESTGLRQVKVKSGKDGQMVTLPSAILFRFIMSPGSIVTDSSSGLQWTADQNITMTWHDARKYVRSLKLGGFTDWRMPTRAELRTLESIDSSFPLNDCCVWTSELKDSRRAWYFNVYRSFDDIAYINNNSYRVIAVRKAE
jgi:hypothetical protein